MIIFEDIKQGTDEWLDLRKGVITASRFKDIVTSKGELSKSYKRYMYEIVGELMGAKEDGVIIKTSYMERGNDLEVIARATYSFIRDVEVKEVGFIMHDNKMIGISPDGLIGEKGGLEIKCPKASTHIKYIDEDRLPIEYKQQVQGCMWISEREWWDFVSYHPDLPIFIKRVYRDEEYIKKINMKISETIEKINVLIDKVNRKLS